jgi:hypothetical protein
MMADTGYLAISQMIYPGDFMLSYSSEAPRWDAQHLSKEPQDPGWRRRGR